MNRLPIIIVLISAVAAGLLWMVASALEREVLQQQISGRTAETSNSQPATPVEQKKACEDVEQGLRVFVTESQQCRTDSDCVVLDYGYPIECMTSVAREKVVDLRTEFRRYHGSCEYRVYYDCPTGEMQRKAVCRNSRCTVDLVTVDSLTEDTLGHLGLDQ